MVCVPCLCVIVSRVAVVCGWLLGAVIVSFVPFLGIERPEGKHQYRGND